MNDLTNTTEEKVETVFVIATDSGDWGKGRTIEDAFVNTKINRASRFCLVVCKGVYEEVFVTEFGHYRGIKELVYQSEKAEKLPITFEDAAQAVAVEFHDRGYYEAYSAIDEALEVMDEKTRQAAGK